MILIGVDNINFDDSESNLNLFEIRLLPVGHNSVYYILWLIGHGLSMPFTNWRTLTQRTPSVTGSPITNSGINDSFDMLCFDNSEIFKGVLACSIYLK